MISDLHNEVSNNPWKEVFSFSNVSDLDSNACDLLGIHNLGIMAFDISVRHYNLLLFYPFISFIVYGVLGFWGFGVLADSCMS